MNQRTTIYCMAPPHPKNKFKYCFEMLNFGGIDRVELEAWCLADPINRRWGNMGCVECNLDSDAIEFITTWGINWPRRIFKTPKVVSTDNERTN